MIFNKKNSITQNRFKYITLFILLSFLQLNIGCKSNVNNELNTKKPKNIILMIGDGMGVSQIYAGMTVNHNKLNIEQFKHIGFSKTYSADNYITDSAAGATAISTGKKTKNGYIGVDSTGNRLKTILEIAEEHELATGLVATSVISHATPASFIAHYPDRHEYEKLANFFIDSDIDVFIGGGKGNFNKRKDSIDLIRKLSEKGYTITDSIQEIANIKSGKLAGFVSETAPKSIMNGRGNMLQVASNTALNILSNNKKGFFLMIEGSQIDWGGHENNSEYVSSEMIDFDKAIGVVLEFAKANGNTLVIVTADHETGGLSLNQGDFNTGEINAQFTTNNHTGVMVPVFAYGPGAEDFTGIYENTEIFNKMLKLYGFKYE